MTRALPADVLSFWRDAGPARWYEKDDGFDAEVRERFLPLYEAAAHGELTAWETECNGSLALVITLDQFPRNIFRDQARAYATDEAARGVADRALTRGYDKRLDRALLAFLFMPFMHSENLRDQDRCIALCRAAGLTETLDYALIHADIIRRFGRFPHRNAVLARQTTPEEAAFLAAGGFAG